MASKLITVCNIAKINIIIITT